MKKVLALGVVFFLILIGATALVIIPSPHTAVAPTGNSTTTPRPQQMEASFVSLDDLIKVTKSTH